MISLISLIIAVFTSIGFPYRADPAKPTRQRLYVHVCVFVDYAFADRQWHCIFTLSILRFHPSIFPDIFFTTISYEQLSNLNETYSEYSLAPTDDVIRFWRSKVKVTAGCQGGEGIHVDAGWSPYSSWIYILVCNRQLELLMHYKDDADNLWCNWLSLLHRICQKMRRKI